MAFLINHRSNQEGLKLLEMRTKVHVTFINNIIVFREVAVPGISMGNCFDLEFFGPSATHEAQPEATMYVSIIK